MPPTVLTTLAWGAGASLLLMLGLWILQLRTGDAGIVDAGWAACIGLLAIGFGMTGEGSAVQRGIAAGVGGVWGARLAIYLLRDRVLAAGEDGRYRQLRTHWGASANLHFLWFFMAQAVLAVMFATPFLLIGQHDAGVSGIQILGLGVVGLSLVFEGIADSQLARFRANPTNRGRVCTDGLWRYSRHPNYFFEWLIWCGVACIAWPVSFGAWALLAPVLMFVFVTRVTGIPYTEAQAVRSRGDAYRIYQRQTNAFFPGPWRRKVCP